MLFQESQDRNERKREDEHRFGDEERRMMRIVPAPAVRLMKRRASSRSGVNCQLLNSKRKTHHGKDTNGEGMRLSPQR